MLAVVAMSYEEEAELMIVVSSHLSSLIMITIMTHDHHHCRIHHGHHHSHDHHRPQLAIALAVELCSDRGSG